MKQSVRFTKMSGAGNDFILLKPTQNLDLKRLAVRICDRTSGIGADGLIVLLPSRKADVRMRIINADGSEAEMCGNGVRCLATYFIHQTGQRKNSLSIETRAGQILVKVQGTMVTARLSDPMDYQPDLPLWVNGLKRHVHYIDTGVPHAVVFVDGIQGMDVATIGRLIRTHPQFSPRGTNVDFVEQLRPDLIAVRTYERGVEGETKACGTGSVASAIVSYLKAHPDHSNQRNARMKIKTSGGEILKVSFQIQEGKPRDVWLTGKVKLIAQGEYYL